MKSRIILCLGLMFLIGAALPASANVTQHCTVGFYKTHSQYLNSGTCTNVTFNPSTVASTLFPDLDPCVGSLTLLGVLNASSSACGTGNIAQAELIMLKQAVARLSNAANSNPVACNALPGTINRANTAIDDAISTDNRNGLIELGAVWDTL